MLSYLLENALFTTPHSIKYSIGGALGNLLNAVTEQWLLVAPLANPAMLEMFADRDSRPYRNLMPWAGEFAGKYLTSAVQVWRLTGDERLRSLLQTFVARLIRFQDRDGYLGPWPADCRLTNFSPHHGVDGMPTWDTWGHYHIMTGLMLWADASGDESSLACARRIADLICRKYLGAVPVRLVDTGSTEMNLAPVHALARLHRITGVSRYLEMALQIVEEFAAGGEAGPLAGDYLNQALAGKALHQMPRPRWESLHSILGLAELFWITGDERYRQAFERIWWGIVEGDRHNNGGFSSGEQATGNPYHPGTIETCCTVAWTVMCAEMLKMTGDSIVADELELTTLNSVMGMHSATGRWATFTTPMDGARFANAHAIVFQSRSGSPELNCCSVNSPRSLGILSQWAVLEAPNGLYLNYYGPCSLHTRLKNDIEVDIRQETDYPISGRLQIHVSPTQEVEFCLGLRIPHWSRNTQLEVNGEAVEDVQPGKYFEIQRMWSPGDILALELDMSLHFWHGEAECQGLVSVYRGPLLLAYDQRYNRHLQLDQEAGRIPDDPFKVLRDCLPVPILDASRIAAEPLSWDGWHAPLLLLEAVTGDGQVARLCDFASAGATGTLYRSWLSVVHAPRGRAFSRTNPLRSAH